jgi:phospholipid-binding lipoprotein MlaA
MKFHRTLLFLTVLFAASGCASQSIKQEGLPVPAERAFKPGGEPFVTPEVAAPMRDESLASRPLLSVEAAESKVQEEVTASVVASVDGASFGTGGEEQIEEDTESSQTQELVSDPWEPFNRTMHGLNNLADEFVIRPAAIGYQKITPEPIRSGVSNFFSNLGVIGTGVNQVLQGQFEPAARSFFRFTVNTTIGIFGVFDPASHLGLPKSDDEDFGQTLAAWGWRESRYLVLPLLGPRTLRDAIGVVGDQPLSPVGQIQDSATAAGLQAMEIVDVRTQLLPADKFRREAFDDYLFVRDAWVQRRKRKIEPQNQ